MSALKALTPPVRPPRRHPSPQNSRAITDAKRRASERLADAPSLFEFMASSRARTDPGGAPHPTTPRLHVSPTALGRKVHIESFGCQMNVNDTQLVYGILQSAGYGLAETPDDADVILLNTCAVRERAEQKVWSRLAQIRHSARPSRPLVGVLGCMAERLKEQILEKEKLVDLIAGPDSYRDLPLLLSRAENGEKAVQVMLSYDETYADVSPVRMSDNGVSAYVSIMRGCNQHCTYCIVPRTRGVERSRPADSIEREIRELSLQGYKEVTLLGQNVNSYNDKTSFPDHSNLPDVQTAKGFTTVYRTPKAGVTFAELLDRISLIDPEMRIRFTSPHPKDFPDPLLRVIQSRPNVCKALHIPAQSGNSDVLSRMRRGYTRETYLELVAHIRHVLSPNVSLSSDFIVGFCDESDAEHLDTLSLVQTVQYDQAFIFAYSMREKTPAHRRYLDNVPAHVKSARLSQLLDAFRASVTARNQAKLGTLQLVLVERTSKRNPDTLIGRTDGNKKVAFPRSPVPTLRQTTPPSDIHFGDYVVVRLTGTLGISFTGVALAKATIAQFAEPGLQDALDLL
ncbi:mitochondrial tRNA methylthiotransferase CDK5RAP1-like [Schistocerca gregaria]|uniref:mitochondrial tRNA methylthiotransferase CDK5RAP1-like n=1 Tax=Schistocerca gregaria TaxID=7010 RepID=UPI00211EEDAA|nr:mitochondrial tRNA methylthiotransferase CDK5RAP1-like [Schistocerca gregaria]